MNRTTAPDRSRSNDPALSRGIPIGMHFLSKL
jgi:hypothetical protein